MKPYRRLDLREREVFPVMIDSRTWMTRRLREADSGTWLRARLHRVEPRPPRDPAAPRVGLAGTDLAAVSKNLQ